MGEGKQDSDDELLAHNLKTLREKAGMSQAALAAAMRERGLPWHQSTVTRVEGGQQQVRFGELRALAAILKTSLDRFTWTSQEASAGMLLDRMIARIGRSWDQIEKSTGSLLYAQYQLEVTIDETERAGCYGSDRIAGIVRDARNAMESMPEDAVESGRRSHEELREAGARLMEEGSDDDADAEGQPGVVDQQRA